MSPNLIEFDFPKDVFIERDYVRVSLKFGEETFFIANDRINVYVPIILDRVRPKYVYT